MKKKTMSWVFLMLLTLFSASTYAQKTHQKNDPVNDGGIRLSIGVDGALPVGSFSDGYDWMLGISAQAEFPLLSDKLYVTVNSGYDYFFGSNNVPNIHLIPVKGGLKYFLAGDFYLQGEAGVSFLANKKHLKTEKSGAFVYAPQVGYLFRLRRNFIDVGARFESNSEFSDGGDHNNFIGLRVAYSFAL